MNKLSFCFESVLWGFLRISELTCLKRNWIVNASDDAFDFLFVTTIDNKAFIIKLSIATCYTMYRVIKCTIKRLQE